MKKVLGKMLVVVLLLIASFVLIHGTAMADSSYYDSMDYDVEPNQPQPECSFIKNYFIFLSENEDTNDNNNLPE